MPLQFTQPPSHLPPAHSPVQLDGGSSEKDPPSSAVPGSREKIEEYRKRDDIISSESRTPLVQPSLDVEGDATLHPFRPIGRDVLFGHSAEPRVEPHPEKIVHKQR